MRTFGQVALAGGQFWIECEPHVMIRLKSVFPRINKRQIGKVDLLMTPETCRDLEWFVARYPLRVEPSAEHAIRHGSEHYQRTLADLEKLMMPDAVRAEFMMALPARPYQAQAVEIYLKKGSLLLADQMGLGKTVCAIASFTDPRTLPALVVCPTHLVKQWQTDFLPKFLPGARVEVVQKGRPDPKKPLKPADVYLCTYHKLAGWAELWKERFFNSIVFDECQELRHGDSGKYSAARAIREKIPFALGLSGTPIYNYGGEIFNVMEVISPGSLGDETEFHREWCHSNGKKQLLTDANAVGAMMREQFLMVRRTRADVGMELPAMQKIVQTIPYDEDVLSKIDNHATELAHLILKGEFTQRGQAARQFDLMVRQQTGIAKAPFVAEFVRMLVEDGQKVLLGGWHRAVYEIWQDRFANPEFGPSLKPVMFTGTESPTEKRKAIDAFVYGNSMVMMMSLRAGSGVDGLQEVCATGVYGELDWSPAVHEQFAFRLNRDGVNRGVCMYYMVSDGGSDPPMSEVLGLKTAQVDGLLGEKPGAEKKDFDQLPERRITALAERYLSRKGSEGKREDEKTGSVSFSPSLVFSSSSDSTQ